jgi:hypothetical protein
VESHDAAKNIRVVIPWRFHPPGDPFEQLGVRRIEQMLKFVQLPLGQPLDLGIDETPKNEVHLPRAPMRGAIEHPPAARVQSMA